MSLTLLGGKHAKLASLNNLCQNSKVIGQCKKRWFINSLMPLGPIHKEQTLGLGLWKAFSLEDDRLDKARTKNKLKDDKDQGLTSMEDGDSLTWLRTEMRLSRSSISKLMRFHRK